MKECIKTVVLQSEGHSWSKLILEDSSCSFLQPNSAPLRKKKKQPPTERDVISTIKRQMLRWWSGRTLFKNGRFNRCEGWIRFWGSGLKSNYSFWGSTSPPSHLIFALLRLPCTLGRGNGPEQEQPRHARLPHVYDKHRVHNLLVSPQLWANGFPSNRSNALQMSLRGVAHMLMEPGCFFFKPELHFNVILCSAEFISKGHCMILLTLMAPAHSSCVCSCVWSCCQLITSHAKWMVWAWH